MKPRPSPLDAALKRFDALFPRAIDLRLGRVLRVLDALGRPQDRLPPVVHVAGTNGKGSTCAFLRAMAEAAGLRVHVYSSPHLVRFNERVRLAGTLISDADMVSALDRVWRAAAGGPITQFEATTAAALLAFSETPADLLVLEVGLGGRFDATNVLDTPALSVIAPVDYDHKEYLSDDLARIAWEKAGIIKPHVPVVIAPQSRIVSGVIALEAHSRGAPAVWLDPDTMLRTDTAMMRYTHRGVDTGWVTPGLSGRHQFQNAGLAALALQTLGDDRITSDAIARGMTSVRWPARLQRLGPGPVVDATGQSRVWLDSGHNPHAGRAIAAAWSAREGERPLMMITGMMANKDQDGILAPFSVLSPYLLAVPNPNTDAGCPPGRLAQAALRQGIPARACQSLDEALARVRDWPEADVLICGSLYLAGEVLALNGELPG